MSDNKKKRGEPDRSLLNLGEAYEVAYAASQLKKEFPTKTATQINRALIDSAKVPQFNSKRAMIMNSARLKLKNS